MMQYAAIIKYTRVSPLPVRADECQVAILRFIDRHKKVFILVGYGIHSHTNMFFKVP